jgi:hypothetical protein
MTRPEIFNLYKKKQSITADDNPFPNNLERTSAMSSTVIATTPPELSVPQPPDTKKNENDNDNASGTANVAVSEHSQPDSDTPPPKDIRFWLVIMSLLVSTFISALDLTGKLIFGFYCL